MKKWIIGGVALGLLVFAIVKYWWLFYLILVPPYKGDQFQTWETRGQKFKLRVNAYHEANGGFVPGAYYTFSSAQIGSEEWTEVMTFRHDDPIDIQTEKVRIVSDDVAFLFMGWQMASTSDGGETWMTWSSCGKAELKACNYEGIKSVEMSTDGHGRMTLSPIPDASPEPTLTTQDFGKTWN